MNVGMERGGNAIIVTYMNVGTKVTLLAIFCRLDLTVPLVQ